MNILLTIIGIVIALVASLLAIGYKLTKENDRISRSGVDPKHDDVDQDALDKIRGKK